uniref:Uncharacterized protein n=1 Tax=Rhizophora mucronata TaxID=61149 RepID=A0A2P2NN11_RHIMU
MAGIPRPGIEKMPSVLVDVSRYPSVHRAFNNKAIIEEEPEKQQQQHLAKPAKKVHISEHENVIIEDRNGNYEVVKESVDVEADGFIMQKHQGFQLCKWKTFKEG